MPLGLSMYFHRASFGVLIYRSSGVGGQLGSWWTIGELMNSSRGVKSSVGALHIWGREFSGLSLLENFSRGVSGFDCVKLVVPSARESSSRGAFSFSGASSSQLSEKMCAFFPRVKSPYFIFVVLCFVPSHYVLPLQQRTMRPIPASSLHVSTPAWWLESRFHFNFAGYYNPANSEFGVLRVLNDDLVKPKAGFGTHFHRDMEILTYVVDGQLTHKDSIGTSESLGRGAVQYMSAGTGILHSEMNSNDDLLRLLQIWIKPDRRGLKPNYGSRVFKKEDRHNKIQHVLTDFSRYEGEKDLGEGVIPIHQDCNMYVSEADPTVEQGFVLSKNRQAYLVCIEGKLSVSDLVHLDTRDALEIRAGTTEDLPLQLKADKDAGAHFLLIEMALV